MSNLQPKRKVRVLDFDIENRPLSYWVPDRPTAEITSIASCWVGSPRTMTVGLLGRDDPRDMLEAFVERYNEADMVTGHYIRRHDLPIINGGLLEYGLPPLQPKLTSDTKLDMVVRGDMPATQEHLAEMFGIAAPKVKMTQIMWREANRLTPEGIILTERRAAGDVKQHMALRKYMIDNGLLSAPRVWRP